MPRLPVSLSALAIRLVTIGLGVLLFLSLLEAREGARWAELLAPAFFLWALWATSTVLVRFDHGEGFEPAVLRGLNEVGTGLMLGALSLILFTPAILHLAGNGFTEMRGVTLGLDVETLTIGLVGLVMVLIARRAGRLTAALREFV